MPPAETSFASHSSVPARVAGWGGGEPAPVRILRPEGAEDFRAVMGGLRDWAAAGAIARGLGRSYGDAAQLTGGFVLDMTRCSRFELDLEQGVVTAQAGATIGSLLEATVPLGWMLPVVPGTQHVTVGGAIASDIHGKNHGIAGTFGSHVRALGLLTGTGRRCSASRARLCLTPPSAGWV